MTSQPALLPSTNADGHRRATQRTRESTSTASRARLRSWRFERVRCCRLSSPRSLPSATPGSERHRPGVPAVIAEKQRIRPFLLVGAAITEGLKRVRVDSQCGYPLRKGWVVYFGTKAAVVALSKACAIELAPKGVRVNTISPGTMLTGMVPDVDGIVEVLDKIQPVGYAANPSQTAAGVLFLASDEADYAACRVDCRWCARVIRALCG
ncbi:SDR family NAD(P)-dependent oxidoreductase [Nocardia donostiensis]|uniref:SDR family NAD(P)-dependent oxidoreductase n=1 Tax=Nocardia donostiensis TaxID=1538463 RepID=UPI0009DA5E1E|nr:SDR family oxidoreductase [Nocardia donostiensis]